MDILLGLLLFVLVYVVAKFLLKYVKGIEEIVEILSIGIAIAVVYLSRGLIL